jgi:hypothetical protein
MELLDFIKTIESNIHVVQLLNSRFILIYFSITFHSRHVKYFVVIDVINKLIVINALSDVLHKTLI